MDLIIIPQPDTIPVQWGYFQFLLLLTFPLHLLAMNAMLGGLAIAIVQQFKGGSLERQLAHRIAIALPLVIAFVVNLGVAPLLFLQVLYGQFVYSSSVLMGTFWILIIPVLIIAYYGAYLFDFKFKALGGLAPWLGILVFLLLLSIGFLFSNNMLLMSLPEYFSNYFSHKSGDLLVISHDEFWPRYLHMILGALAVGGLFVALLGRFKADKNQELATHSKQVGLRVFTVLTAVNVAVGFWYLLSLPKEQMKLFMGGNMLATVVLMLGILLAFSALYSGYKGKFWVTFFHLVPLVWIMSFIRSWLRSGYLENYFTLPQLQVIPQYSPFIFFIVTLLLGVIAVGWLIKKSARAMNG